MPKGDSGPREQAGTPASQLSLSPIPYSTFLKAVGLAEQGPREKPGPKGQVWHSEATAH